MPRFLSLLFLFASCPALPAQAPGIPSLIPLSQVSPAELLVGRHLFQQNCALCHGIDGSGLNGPSLRHPRLARAPDDRALVDLIIWGIPDAGMPRSFHLLPDGPRFVAAYVRTLGRAGFVSVLGDAKRGERIYLQNRCPDCHIVQGQGAGIGPELSDVAERRSPPAFRQILSHPETELPEGFLMVLIQLKEGAFVEGMRANEDTFSIQVKDSSGVFHSFRKSELRTLSRESSKTIMPSYKTLSSENLTDLIAYLSGLRTE